MAGRTGLAVQSVCITMVRLSRTFKPSSLPVRLRGGGGVWILRRLQKNDAQLLRDFFLSHSAETIRLRYGYPRTDLTLDQARELAGVDQRKHAALAVLVKENGEDRIVAVGRYTKHPEEKQAEMAFVVDERYRRRGLATLLVQALKVIAKSRGLTKLTAETLMENFAMLRVFIQQGARVSENLDTERTEVVIPLV